MEDKKNNRGRGWTGLAKHGSTVSLAPARAVSSHARRLYKERYAGRYRFARLVFAFDLFLLGIAASLAVFSLNLAYRNYLARPAGLELVFEAPAVMASDILPVQLTVKATDGKAHGGVKLRWHLPAWVEIAEAYPRLAADGSLDLGTVKPGLEGRSRLMVRVRGKVGDRVPFGFTVAQYDPLLFSLTYAGSETRTIERAALSVRAAVPGAAYLSGASVPLVVENAGRRKSPSVILRLVTASGAPDAALGKDRNFELNGLEPGERRMVFVDLGKLEGPRFDLGFELQDAAQIVQTYALGAEAATGCALDITRLKSDGAGFELDYAARGKARILAVGGTPQAYKDIPLNQVSGTYGFAVSPTEARGSWDIVPIDMSGAKACVGARQTAAAADALPVTAEARYYALTGDQLGVGPLPPVAGEATSYWIVWSIGPFNANLKDVRLSATFPPGVKATGKYSSAVSGDFGFEDGSVSWHTAELKIVGTEKVSVAFEATLTPSREQIGSNAQLLGKTRVTAATDQGNQLDFELPIVDTDLKTDGKAQGKGKVIGE